MTRDRARRGVWKVKLTPYRWCGLVAVVLVAVVLQEVSDPLRKYQYGFLVWQAVMLLVLFGDDVVREAGRLWRRARAPRHDVL